MTFGKWDHSVGSVAADTLVDLHDPEACIAGAKIAKDTNLFTHLISGFFVYFAISVMAHLIALITSI